MIVFGIAFYYPLAGVTYQFLHYLLGLKSLGFDTYYVEDSERRVYNPGINDMTEDPTNNVRQVGKIFDDYGFAGHWAYRSHFGDRTCYGMTNEELKTLYEDADVFLNVTGAQEIRDEHFQIPCRIYVESDPFAAQVRVSQQDNYWLNLLGAHTHHFSFGENLGQSDCPVPMERFSWERTRQPVAMELWQNGQAVGGAEYTTVTTWSNKGNDIEYQGVTYYWTKNLAFQRMINLPQRSPAQQFRIAVKAPKLVLDTLVAHGWHLADSLKVSSDINDYKAFIQSSRGEFTVARDQYVRGKTGWQSDRSVCYLAAGRPVVTEDTGFGKFVPTGEGLFAFSDMEQALTAFESIESDYPAHCKAARDIAIEYFDAAKVVGNLMARANMY